MHECNAFCWADMIRYGHQEGCDPWAARQAAVAALRAEGALVDD